MTNELPIWRSEGVSPPETLKNTGWKGGDRPPHQYLNWFMNRSYESLKYLTENQIEILENTTSNYENLSSRITASQLQLVNQITNTATELSEKVDVIKGTFVLISDFPRFADEPDDTQRIERAISYLSSIGGGKLYFSIGVYIAKQIKLRSRVYLVGAGRSTRLKMANGSNNDFIILQNEQAKHCGLFDLSIDGNKANNTSGIGVYMNCVGAPQRDPEDLYPDHHHFFDNLHIFNCANTGFVVQNQMRELQFNRIICFRNNGSGMFLGGSDHQISNCVFYWNKSHGFEGAGANVRMTGIKCFGNEGNGFHLFGTKRMTGSVLEAQENGLHGFNIAWVEDVTLQATISDANGYNWYEPQAQPNEYSGYRVFHAQNFILNGKASNFHVKNGNAHQPSRQTYGVWVSGSQNYEINIVSNYQYADYWMEIASRGRGLLKVNGEIVTEKPTDFYEQGTFIPALVNSNATYTQQRGDYTKIGNRLFIEVYLVVDQIGTSTSSPAIANLPFPRTGASPDSRFIVNCHVQNQVSETDYVAVINNNMVELRLKDLGWATYNNLMNGTVIRINGSYRI